MKYLILFFSLLTSQVRSQCFEIESILVDACAGSQEGQNEMVTFQVGSIALNTSALTVNWPSNSWLGLCQNPGTASDVATVNSTILGCGFLKEPVGGVLPPNAKVILVTSTAWTPLAQSFVNLSDTLYIIFQCAGNTSGHFANYGTGIRTLTMSFSSPVGCSDVVSYDRSLLLNQSLLPGAQDGAIVEFNATGSASYTNHGCQAPFIPLSLEAGPDKVMCMGSTQTLTATVNGSYNSIVWSGGSGTFSPSSSLTTTYTSGAGDNGTIRLYCSALKLCGTQTITVKDSVTVVVNPVPSVSISPSSIALCPGQSVSLQANANSVVSYTWNTGANTNTLSVNSVGIYTVQVSNLCGSALSTITVTPGSSPVIFATATPTALCSGQTSTISLSGSVGSYHWSNGTTSFTTMVSSAGVYTASVSNGCGTASISVNILSSPNPSVSIIAMPSSLCSGITVTLTAVSNATNVVWNTGALTSTLSVNLPGMKTVSATNACGTASASIIVTNGNAPLVLSTSAYSICPGETATLTVTGGEPLSPGDPVIYNWSTSALTGSMITTGGGTITVSNTTACGTQTASINVITNSLLAGLSASPQTGVKPLTVHFTNNSHGDLTDFWSFGNGNSAVTQTVQSQTYTSAGDYIVYLVVSNGICTGKDSLTIHVLDNEPWLVIPNVFTPNGDQVNDLFRVNGYDMQQFTCTIYDRWGVSLFSWSDLTTGWDGKHNGKEAADGTYFYLIQAKDLFNQEIHKQGSFSLFR